MQFMGSAHSFLQASQQMYAELGDMTTSLILNLEPGIPIDSLYHNPGAVPHHCTWSTMTQAVSNHSVRIRQDRANAAALHPCGPLPPSKDRGPVQATPLFRQGI